MPSAQPTLAGGEGDFVLRPWRVADAEAVAAACQDPEIARWIPIPQPYTRAVAEGFIEGCLAAWEEGSAAAFAIASADDERLLGAITRHGPFGGTGHRASFGYWLAPWARGRGVATRALLSLVGWTLDTTQVIRCDLYANDGNDASGRVALRAGFAREGTLRAWEVDHGIPVDCVFYARLRGE